MVPSAKVGSPLSTSSFFGLIKRNWSTIAAFSLSVVAFMIAWTQMTSNVFPPGDDPGNWLKRVNALAGKTYPLWNESVFTYPPFFFSFSYTVSFVLGDRLTALKLAGTLAFSAVPFSTFLFAKRVTGNTAIGLASSWIMAFLPSQFEMLWWGGYPNLLALAMMPIAFLTLFLAQKGSLKYLLLSIVAGAVILFTHHLTSLVFLGTLAMAALASVVVRDKEAFKADFVVLVVSAIVLAAIWKTNLPTYVTQNPLISKPGTLTLDSFLAIFKDPLLLFLGLALAIMGMVELFFLGRLKENILTIAWLFSSLFLTQLHLLGMVIDYRRFLFMASTPLAVLASVSLINLKNCLTVAKTNGEDSVYQVEVQVEKAAPVAIVLILLLLTPLRGVATSQTSYDYYVWETRYSNQGRLQALDWIKQHTSENATIAGDFNIGRWIEGYGERRALFPVPPEAIFIQSEFARYLAADAILNSNHQLANRYLKLDEWEPLSSEFSPLVSVFRTNHYVGLVCLSDSFVKVNLTSGGSTWIEAPYNASLYQSKWLERTQEEAELQISFRTKGLTIEKKLNLRAEQPNASVVYRITPASNVTLNTVSMDVFMSWDRTLIYDEVVKNEVTLMTDAGRIKVSFLGGPYMVKVGKDPEFKQNRIYAEFKAEADFAEVGVVFEVLNPQPSWVDGVWASSSGELEHNYGVTYISFPANAYATKRLKFSPAGGSLVYIDDCYARVEFRAAGNLWVEAPYKARVIGEQNDKVNYETKSLYVNKTMVQYGFSIDVKYEVKAKEGFTLERLNLSVWLPWGRFVNTFESRNGTALLVTDAGALEVKPHGKVLNVTYGLDEEFHMPRILITYGLSPGQDEASLTLSSLNDYSMLSAEVDKTTRPAMESSDKIRIEVTSSQYREVFRNSEIVIYETPHQTSRSPSKP